MIAITIPAMTTGTFTALVLLIASFALSTLLLTLAQYTTAPDNSDTLDAAELADLLQWIETSPHDAPAHTPDSPAAPDARVARSQPASAVWWDTWL